MPMPLSIAPSALKKSRRYEREAWSEYASLRAKALAAGKAYRSDKTGRNMLAHEDAIFAALESRRWAWEYTKRREWAESVPIEAHGGRVCPAALDRLRARGRLKNG